MQPAAAVAGGHSRGRRCQIADSSPSITENPPCRGVIPRKISRSSKSSRCRGAEVRRGGGVTSGLRGPSSVALVLLQSET
ncbi:hypothetical protein TNCV_3754621 [Trichonephila clavipes]|nr:hypothetical protein TNCV_3754621 [Trichonephila clavipes]